MVPARKGDAHMKKAAAGVAIFLLCATSTARAVDVDEQSRRCDIEKNALRNSSHREGPECLKLRAMLGMPEPPQRSEEHTSELQSLMRISYAVFCLKKKTKHEQCEKHHSTTNTKTRLRRTA